MSKPKVIKAGNNPDCVHREHIDGELIGTCCKCGQVRNYRQVWARDIDPVMKQTHGDATLEQVQQSRKKGGKASQKGRGSANENSAGWAAIKRPPRVRSTELPVLVKGEDF